MLDTLLAAILVPTTAVLGSPSMVIQHIVSVMKAATTLGTAALTYIVNVCTGEILISYNCNYVLIWINKWEIRN